MGDIHLLGSNLHVLWLCLTYTVRFESIVLFIHILSTHNLLFLHSFLTPPPFVSNGQHSTYEMISNMYLVAPCHICTMQGPVSRSRKRCEALDLPVILRPSAFKRYCDGREEQRWVVLGDHWFWKPGLVAGVQKSARNHVLKHNFKKIFSIERRDWDRCKGEYTNVY